MIRKKIKTCLCLLAIIFSIQQANSQNRPGSSDQNVARYCKVMGFLKYYHPLFTKGMADWDDAFVSHYQAIGKEPDEDIGNKLLAQYIDSLNVVSANARPQKSKIPDAATGVEKIRPVITSMNCSELINERLWAIFRNRNCDRQSYYVTPDNIDNPKYLNEKDYKGMYYPNEAYRVLALARLWNVIEYFSPYKELTDVPWDSVLYKSIPGFIEVTDSIKYSFCLRRLIVMMNDMHCYDNAVFPPGYGEATVKFKLPLDFVFIEDKLFAANIRELCSGIVKPGDEILSIDGVPIDTFLKKGRMFIPVSNENRLRDIAARGMRITTKDTTRLRINRENVIMEVSLQGSKSDPVLYEKELPADTLLDGNIGYIKLSAISLSKINTVVKRYKSCQGIVFDLRSYPEFVLYKVCKQLSAEKKPFVRWCTPNFQTPGSFDTSFMYCGKQNRKQKFTGRIAILVDASTQSKGEFTAMALQTLPYAKTVGRQTSGTDGDVSVVTLPGGYYTKITGMGVSYPDGTASQRAGVRIDIKVLRTKEGMATNKDYILERGLQYIREGQ